MTTGTGRSAAYRTSFASLCAGTFDALLNATGAHRTLLDVGCGTGELAGEAVRRGRTVTALDPDADMVAATRWAVGTDTTPDGYAAPAAGASEAQWPTATVLRAAAPALPFPDRSQPAVTANFVVHHVPDPRATAADLARVLAHDGTLAMTIWPSAPGPHLRAIRLAAEDVGADLPAPAHLPADRDFPRSPAGLAALAEDAGLEVRRSEQISWSWRTTADDVMTWILAGIAGPGRLYRAQDPARRRRLEDAIRQRWSPFTEGDHLVFPVTAVLVVATRA